MSRPTNQSLIRFIVSDLKRDTRCAEGRDSDMAGMREYAAKCRVKIATIYHNRHGLKLDKFGQIKP